MGTPEERFRRIYTDNFDPVLAYALRRVDTPADAADVVAETFLVAWRRIEELPPPEEIRLWLFGTARRMLANNRRGLKRRTDLTTRLGTHLESLPSMDPAELASAHIDVHRCLGRLGELEREALMLACWEGLAPREIARVLGVRPATVRTRLARARATMRRFLPAERPATDQSRHECVPSGHVSHEPLSLNPKDTR